MTESIKQYWSDRAKSSAAVGTATTNDIYLRVLEAKTLANEIRASTLPNDATVLDVGCGDGQTIVALSKEFPQFRFLGIDYSPEMISAALATRAADADLQARAEFRIGDVTRPGDVTGGRKFSLIISNRCLINLASKDAQYDAIARIAGLLADGGWYMGTENFVGGQARMNELRRLMELDPIAIRWHNLFFDEDELLDRLKKIFAEVSLIDFSSTYYLATRVIYSMLCKHENLKIDYAHPVHKLAVELPAAGDFSPIKLIRARI